MAVTKANLARYRGGQDVWGGHGVKFFLYTGPSSYQGGAGGGDEVDDISVNNQTSMRGIDAVYPSAPASGTFRCFAGPLSTNPPGAQGPPAKWVIRWIVNATGAEVANGVDLSAEKAIVMVVGG